MRIIKSRGKCAKDSKYAGEWVEGGLVQCEKGNDVLIINAYTDTCTSTYHVDPKTVGLFTGLVDKNGNEIYEDDIITYYVSLKKVDGEFVEDTRKTVVEWDGAGFNIASLSKITHTIEVIGNIHDNPELMNG